VGVERLNVVLDTKAHDHLSLMIGVLGPGQLHVTPACKRSDRHPRRGLEEKPSDPDVDTGTAVSGRVRGPAWGLAAALALALAALTLLLTLDRRQGA
jgi:hypothetical protein